MILQTERLVLRELAPSDFKDLSEIKTSTINKCLYPLFDGTSS